MLIVVTATIRDNFPQFGIILVIAIRLYEQKPWSHSYIRIISYLADYFIFLQSSWTRAPHYRHSVSAIVFESRAVILEPIFANARIHAISMGRSSLCTAAEKTMPQINPASSHKYFCEFWQMYGANNRNHRKNEDLFFCIGVMLSVTSERPI